MNKLGGCLVAILAILFVIASSAILFVCRYFIPILLLIFVIWVIYKIFS